MKLALILKDRSIEKQDLRKDMLLQTKFDSVIWLEFQTISRNFHFHIVSNDKTAVLGVGIFDNARGGYFGCLKEIY